MCAGGAAGAASRSRRNSARRAAARARPSGRVRRSARSSASSAAPATARCDAASSGVKSGSSAPRPQNTRGRRTASAASAELLAAHDEAGEVHGEVEAVRVAAHEVHRHRAALRETEGADVRRHPVEPVQPGSSTASAARSALLGVRVARRVAVVGSNHDHPKPSAIGARTEATAKPDGSAGASATQIALVASATVKQDQQRSSAPGPARGRSTDGIRIELQHAPRYPPV